MALPIRWSPKATKQLETIVAYIAEDSSRYAAIFAKRVMQTIRTIPERPHTGRMVPEYADPELRENSCRAIASSTESTPTPSNWSRFATDQGSSKMHSQNLMSNGLRLCVRETLLY